MSRVVYRYCLVDGLDLQNVEDELVLAVASLECLYGHARARLEAVHFLDHEKRTLIIDATTEVGEDFNRLFIGGLLRENDPDSFTVQRLPAGTTISPKTPGYPPPEWN